MFKIDNIYSVEIPEGVDLDVELAGFIPRVLAYSIDFLFRYLVLMVLSLVLVFFGEMGTGIWLVIFFLAEWIYPVYFEVYRQGQTPGKKQMGLAVTTEDLVPISLQASLIRNLLRVADFLPLFYSFGLISLITTKKFQRLGDLAARTIVVYRSNQHNYSKINIDVRAITPPAGLTETQQQAIIQFTINGAKLSAARQQELAEILRDVIPPTENPVTYVQGMGKWLLGDK